MKCCGEEGVTEESWGDVVVSVQAGNEVSESTMIRAIQAMLEGSMESRIIADLLLALRDKGETAGELTGAALAMRSAMTPVSVQQRGLLDTCGTGGDGSKTFNISTAAAIVAAAAGVAVAKHGNRKVTSATGSADVFAELGIRIDAPRHIVERCIDELGIGFCFAPLLHPALRRVADVRRSLGVTTLFNYLGPLCNPAGADFQILGVGNPDLQPKLAHVLARLKIQKAIVVRGADGMDEVTLSETTHVYLVEPEGIKTFDWTPADFGLEKIDKQSLLVDTPSESANVIRAILHGRQGPARDIVLANAAAGVWVAGKCASLPEAVEICASAIDSGRALNLLEQLSILSHQQEAF